MSTTLQLTRVRENVPAAAPVLTVGSKTVYFIRHGQSVANTVPEHLKHGNASLRDCPLTETGQAQAAALQDIVLPWDVQLVVVSPLTRALQTACLAFAKAPPTPMIASPLVTEFYPEYFECMGRPTDDLRQDPALVSLAKFPSVSLDNVGPDWWSISGDHGRLQTFLHWLNTCVETRIAVVAHWGFIHHFMNLARCPMHLEIRNCCFIESMWSPAPLGIEPQAREYALWLVPRTADPTLMQLEAYMRECRNSPALSQTTLVAQSRGQLHISVTGFTPLSELEKADLPGQMRDTVSTLMSQRGSPWAVSPETFALILDESHHTVWLRVALQSTFLRTLTAEIQKLPTIGAVTRVDNFGLTLLVDDRETGCVPLETFYAAAGERHPLMKALIESGRGVAGTPPVNELLRGLHSLTWSLCLVSRQADDKSDTAFEPILNLPLML